MRLRDGAWSFDSRDLMRSTCDHCVRLAIARELDTPGLKPLLQAHTFAPSGLPIVYGNLFETQLEVELSANLGDRIRRPARAEHNLTVELMRAGVPVIYQGALKGGSAEVMFSGRPDFLLRGDYQFEFGEAGLTATQLDGGDPTRYSAWDAKLSSTAKPEYQNQVGLYCDVLETSGLLSGSPSGLILGSRELAQFSGRDLIADLGSVRPQLVSRIQELAVRGFENIEAIGELVCVRSSACDICEYPTLCQLERERLDHLQLVANITSSKIVKLRAAGINTMTELAAMFEGHDLFEEKQVRQAKAQLLSTAARPYVEVRQPKLLSGLPRASRYDVFFDIEGFTFYPGGGLEYLLGWVTVDSPYDDPKPAFHGLWSDDRVTESANFEAFVASMLDRQRWHQDFHIYHYAAYEKTALKRLAKRFGKFEAEMETLISSGVFVDLYQLVSQALTIGQPKYSIKNLEQYYSFQRNSEVKEAMGSMEYYHAYLEALQSSPDEAEMLKRQVLSYNRDDCVSTLALRDWLLSLGSET